MSNTKKYLPISILRLLFHPKTVISLALPQKIRKRLSMNGGNYRKNEKGDKGPKSVRQTTPEQWDLEVIAEIIKWIGHLTVLDSAAQFYPHPPPKLVAP